MLDGALHLATPVSDRRFFQAEGRLSPLRVAQDATAGGRAWCSLRGGRLDFEGCRWFDHQVVAAVTVRGVSAIDGFFAGSRLGGVRVALAEGTVRHRLVAVFAGGCAPGGRLALSRSGCRAALAAMPAAEAGGRVSESFGLSGG